MSINPEDCHMKNSDVQDKENLSWAQVGLLRNEGDGGEGVKLYATRPWMQVVIFTFLFIIIVNKWIGEW
jgi:hypothetical protein